MATREELKSYFETDDIPTQEQFWELIDSMAIVGEDNSGSVSAIIGQSWNNTQKALARANIGFDDALDDWIVTWDSIEAGAIPVDRLPSVVGRRDQANTWAETQLFQKPITVQDGGGNNVFDVTTNQIRFRSAVTGYILSPSGQILAGEDAGGFYFAGGFTSATKPIYLGQPFTTQIIANAQTINNRTSEFNIIGVDGTGWGAFRAGQATFNGPLTITKTGSNGLIVNNTVGNALAIFNASAASVTDNAYWTIQTAGSDRWYVGQSVSGLTGNFEIYGTAFGGSVLTLNRTTGAMTAQAATFNGNTTVYGQISANSVGSNIRLKANGSDALDGGVLANGLGTIYLSNWNANRGIRINADGSIATIGTGATTFNGDILALTRLGVGASGFASEKVRIQDTANSPLFALIRNDDAGSSATSGLVLNAYGNSWGIRMGSAANNSNALEIREDALGANTLRFRMAVGGAASFNGNVDAPAFTATVVNNGSVAMSQGGVGNTGYFAWFKPNGTRHTFVGFDAGNDLTFVNEVGGGFIFNGPITTIGNARLEQLAAKSMSLRTYETSLSAWQEPWRGQASASGATIGFLGATPIVRQTLPAAATDAATTQTLANALRDLAINFGLAN